MQVNIPHERYPPNACLQNTLILFFLVTGGCVLHAQEKIKLPGNDWIQLFNGTT